MKALLAVLLLATVAVSEAAPKQIRVFVALCDNATQGIQPVGPKIGNGDDADANLYWGCSDGLPKHFGRSGRWEGTKSEKDLSPTVLRRVELTHTSGEMVVTAEAYRGSDMRQCLVDFEQAAASGKYSLVAFIGHNGLMDFTLPEVEAPSGKPTDVVVLCCLSEWYFRPRMVKLGCRPVLMTKQLMYPGSFILHDVLESWHKGGTLPDIRNSAAKAYAKNQRISVKAAAGIFADLQKRPNWLPETD